MALYRAPFSASKKHSEHDPWFRLRVYHFLAGRDGCVAGIYFIGSRGFLLVRRVTFVCLESVHISCSL
jgi:hypothetical protein